MAPIKDETTDSLKNVIHDLEARVAELEQRLVHGGTAPPSPTESMRMVLMGPPGAGMP